MTSVSLELLRNTLGYPVSEVELQPYEQKLQYLEPTIGKFFPGSGVNSGLYIVLSGKVRLLDETGELISTLELGGVFGHFTLFPDDNFIPYTARASKNLKLCLIPGEIVAHLMAKYPEINQYLNTQAKAVNSLLLKSNEEDQQKILPTPAPSLTKSK
ncbi:cyclic nucleotide-binding domain-containing protein [Anabaena minutissima FACHB-250]|nr:cyclic nucleotide-binding domain-containing protein [Anabaena minutissima FACHB-250]